MRWFGLALALVAFPAAAASPRTPVWPTEVARVAAPLRAVGPGEDRGDDRERVRAVQALLQFSTESITPSIMLALDDPSVPVRREALGVCYARRILACVDEAAKLWRDGRESTIRIAALRVVAMAPAEHAGLLRDALRDRAETVRAQAAQFLGWAPLSPAERGRARSALLVKLSDLSAVVRRHVVDSLGLIGDGDAVLPVARLLSDPEPTVRAAAATALGRLHDDRAVPPLRRALDEPNEPLVTKAIVRGLAQLGGDPVEQDLLDLLDDPPQGLDAPQIADAIGRRRSPGGALVEGLVERLREPELRGPALDALLLLGESAHPRLKAARARGLEAPLEAEVDALLGAPATALPRAPAPPAPGDATAWRARLHDGALDQRLGAGAELGAAAPAWLGQAIEGQLVPGRVEPARRRGWLVALTTVPTSIETETPAPAVLLAGWALDPARADADRCLAAAALSAVGGRTDDLVVDTLVGLLADRRAAVRGCAASGLGRRGQAEALAVALADPVARVRTAAALALVGASRPDAIDGRLRTMATTDPDGAVRRAARAAAALSASRGEDPKRSPWWHATVASDFPWAAPTSTIEVELVMADGRSWRIDIPTVAHGRTQWAWLPALPAEATVRVDTVASAG